MKTIESYIQEAKDDLFSLQENSKKQLTDKEIQKILFDLVRVVKENPDMKDSDVKQLVNGVQKVWLQHEMDKK
jgi:hypothetical protein